MNNIGIVIQCRDYASRYMGKSVIPFYGIKSILEIIIDRLKYLPFKIVVATTLQSPETIRICDDLGISCIVGSEDDVLERMYETACVFNFDGIFRVCADNPFIQLPLMYPIKIFAESGKFDYVSFDGSMRRHEGFFMEYISTRALGSAYESCTSKYDREHVTPFIISHPYIYFKKILYIPKTLDLYNIRLTVDKKTDFKIAQTVYRNMREAHWIYLVDWCVRHKEIYDKMQENIKRNPK